MIVSVHARERWRERVNPAATLDEAAAAIRAAAMGGRAKGCARCGKPVRESRRQYCSKSCARRAHFERIQARGNDKRRFWSYVDKSAGADGCWPWKGSLCKGYGQTKFHGHTKAHRVAYLLEKGAIPDNLMVLHRCGNPVCCNPGHLYAGTNSDNQKDSVAHGTFSYNIGIGERNRSAKLKEADVLDIRRLLDAGQRQHDVATRYGVSQSLISQIKLGLIWKGPAQRVSEHFSRGMA